jgi:hypothetical protein
MSPCSSLEEGVKALVEDTADSDRRSMPTRPDWSSTGTSWVPIRRSAAPLRTRPARVATLAAACVAVVGVIATISLVAAQSPDSSDPRAADTSTSSGSTRPRSEPTTHAPDVDAILAHIRGTVAIPADRPADANLVQVRGMGASEGTWTWVQQGNAVVVVCSLDGCPPPPNRSLRTVIVDGVTFRVLLRSADKLDDRVPDLAEPYASYWRTVDFVDHRPSWLTDAYESGEGVMSPP